VADELGTAVLRLILDDSALKAGLQEAKAQIEGELSGTIQKATGGPRGGRGSAGQKGRVGRQRAEGINARIQVTRQLLQLESQLNKLDAQGGQTDQLRTRLLEARNQAAQGLFGSARQSAELIKNEILQEKIKLDLIKKQTDAKNKAAKGTAGGGGGGGGGNPPNGPRGPNTGTRDAERAEERLSRARRRGALFYEKAAEKEIQARRKLTTEITSNALIGAGFPLLFGQGVGAAVGGGLGGAAGAGFGGTAGFAGSIVGTALGAAFDATLQKAQTLAQGLQTPISSFDALKEASLLSSKSVEKQAEALIAVGRNAEAAIVIQADLQKTFGDAASAKDYLNAVDDLNRAWSQATTLLGSFVAGPLAKFLEGISKRVQPTPPPDIRAERRRQGALLSDVGFGVTALSLGLAATPAAPVAIGGLAVGAGLVGIGSAFSAGGDEAKAAEQAAAAAKVEREQAAKINELRKATKKELSDSYKLITATVQGDRAALDLAQKQAIINEKNAALRNLAADGVTSSADARVVAVEEEAAKKLFDLKERQLQKDREITAAQYVQTVQTELQLRGIQERITAAQQLAGAEQGVTRETLRGIIAVRQGIQEARRREQNIGAEISAARISGAEPEEVASLVRQQQIAAAETRAKLFEGALALQEAGEKLRKDLTAAVLDFTKIRSDPQGLNRFLSGADRARRAEQDFQLLLPQFRQAQARFQELTGASAPEFRGTTEGVNAAIRDFIEATNREFEARQNLIGAQQSLEQVNQALYDINTQLVGATNALVAKDWVVSVNVVNQAGGASTVNAVNGLS